MRMTFRDIPKLIGPKLVGPKPICALALVLGGLLYGNPGAAQERTVDFSREVRPILSQNCFVCHGPADDRRRRDLRLDTP